MIGSDSTDLIIVLDDSAGTLPTIRLNSGGTIRSNPPRFETFKRDIPAKDLVGFSVKQTLDENQQNVSVLFLTYNDLDGMRTEDAVGFWPEHETEPILKTWATLANTRIHRAKASTVDPT